MKSNRVSLSDIRANENNPRTITEDNLQKLINSILELPKMLEMRPIITDGDGVILGGNMRHKALCRIAGMTEAEISSILNGLRSSQRKTEGQMKKLSELWIKWLKAPFAYVVDASTLTPEEKEALVKKAFFVAKQLGGAAWGLFSVGNAFYMRHSISTNQQILGCFMGIPNPSLQQFDPEQPLKEDFEFVLRHIAAGRKTVRFNDLCMTATLHTKGGCHEAWNSEGDRVNQFCNERILALYPELVKPHPTRKNEQRYVGPSATIKQSIFDI